jgi:hypothetical protein
VALAQKALNVSLPSCLTPYKLCDYKPAYGLIYAQELKGYDYWGDCDLDVIFGRLSHFLTPDIFGRYDRYFTQGHFCFYANKEEVNRRCLLPLPRSLVTFQKLMKKPNKDYLCAQDCYGSEAEWGFDEIFMNPLWKKNHFSQFDQPEDYLDVNEFHYRFQASADKRFGTHPLYFSWEEGLLSAIGQKKQGFLAKSCMPIFKKSVWKGLPPLPIG